MIIVEYSELPASPTFFSSSIYNRTIVLYYQNFHSKKIYLLSSSRSKLFIELDRTPEYIWKTQSIILYNNIYRNVCTSMKQHLISFINSCLSYSGLDFKEKILDEEGRVKHEDFWNYFSLISRRISKIFLKFHA